MLEEIINSFESDVIAFNGQTLVEYYQCRHPHQLHKASTAIIPVTDEEELNENDLLNLIKKMKIIDKYIENQKILKTIYLKNKLINIITNEK